MTYEYTIEFVPLEEGALLDEAHEGKDRVYACAQSGECTIRDLRAEQIEYLQRFLNEMGQEGWELVQIFFYRIGAISFWKRSGEARPAAVRYLTEGGE